jgi:hypothetical protein
MFILQIRSELEGDEIRRQDEAIRNVIATFFFMQV